MSETKTHIGKAKEFTRLEGESTKDYVVRFLEYRCVDDIEKLITDYNEDYHELIDDLYGWDFTTRTPASVTYINDTIYELLVHKEVDDGDISYGSKNEDGTIDFVLQFYNGGTYFEECFQEVVEKIKTT